MNAPQSQFVTALAWLTIVVGALGVASSFAQTAMVGVVLTMLATELGSVVATLLPGLSLISLAGSLLTLFVGISLLRRRGWARVTMVVLLIVGIVFAIIAVFASLCVLLVMDGSLLEQYGFTGDLQSLLHLVLIVMGVGSVAVVGVHLWLIARLRAPEIKAEFTGDGNVRSTTKGP